MKFLRRKFFVSQCRKISYGKSSVLCFRKFLVAKKLMAKRKGEVSRISIENFLSHSADKIRRGTLLGFERNLVSKSFKQRRGKASRFCRNFFFSQDRKNFVGEPFYAVFQKISGSQKV